MIFSKCMYEHTYTECMLNMASALRFLKWYFRIQNACTTSGVLKFLKWYFKDEYTYIHTWTHACIIPFRVLKFLKWYFKERYAYIRIHINTCMNNISVLKFLKWRLQFYVEKKSIQLRAPWLHKRTLHGCLQQLARKKPVDRQSEYAKQKKLGDYYILVEETLVEWVYALAGER